MKLQELSRENAIIRDGTMAGFRYFSIFDKKFKQCIEYKKQIDQ